MTDTKTQMFPVTKVVDFGGDPYLKTMCAMAEDGSIVSMGITLTVGGTVISGELVGHSSWLAEVELAYEPMKFVTGGFRQANDEDKAAEGYAPEDVEFAHVHLRNAHYMLGSAGFVPARAGGGMHWRGRISQVDGWSYGVFKPEPA